MWFAAIRLAIGKQAFADRVVNTAPGAGHHAFAVLLCRRGCWSGRRFGPWLEKQSPDDEQQHQKEEKFCHGSIFRKQRKG